MLPDLIFDFLHNPTDESYNVLRQAVLGSPSYQPASEVLYRFSDAVRAGELDEAEQHRKVLFPTFLLSPRAHLDYGQLLSLQGDEKGEGMEHFFARLLGEFLMRSGDGSLQRPFQISCVDDEYFVLHRLSARTKGQSLRWFQGQLLEIQHTRTGDVHFNIHPLIEAYPA